MSTIITIRPCPGDAATLARAHEMGLNVISHPLFRVESVAWKAPDPARFDALLIGSANVVRHGGPEVARISGLPAWCVGETTAEAAQEAGFVVAHVGAGGLQPVAESAVAAGNTQLLRLSGEAHVPLNLPSKARLESRIVYRVAASPLEPALCSTLAQDAIVLLHSAEAARHFAVEVDRSGLSRSAIALACLGPRIAEAAGAGWRTKLAAERIDDAALLALAGQMCQTIGGSHE